MLILTSASSTGKTTIARALRRLTPTPVGVVAADAFDLPRDARSLVAVREAGEDAAAALQAAMFKAFFEGLASRSTNGPWPK